MNLEVCEPNHSNPSESGVKRKRALVLVRHGQSEDNAKDLFSGLREPGLTPRGVEEAREAGRALGISPRTIEVHRARIMEKLGAKNAADLVRIVLSASEGRSGG